MGMNFKDDNQIKKLDLEMMPEKGGFVEVSIEAIAWIKEIK